LLAFSKDLHELIWTKAKISEEDKPLLVSGTLIALKNADFMKTFAVLSVEKLQIAWLQAIKDELEKADMPQAKKDTMLQPYSTIAVHPNLGAPDSKTAKEYPDGVFKEIIERICDNVWPYISVYHDFDVVGQFYGEFLKYTGGDKKALGIVLTPRHIAELFSLLANVGPESKVLDICTGTGAFLISAMRHMLGKAVTEEERTDIKKNRLLGIENNPKMFALAASNMILRGDGKANLHQGAIGVGVDLATGLTLRGTWLNDKISHHPDTGNAVDGVQLPCWERFMQLAASCYELCHLGYIGVDMVLDQEQGPMLLELNARPGLNIQIANDCGLTLRTHAIEAHIEQLKTQGITETPEQRVKFSQNLFGHLGAVLARG